MTLDQQLKAHYGKIKQLDDNIPSDLAKKISLYSEALLIIGKLHAAATYEYGMKYAARKQSMGILLATTQGTAAEKEGQAEMGSADHRQAEAKAESEMIEWKNTYDATKEIIQALKMELKVLLKEYGGE